MLQALEDVGPVSSASRSSVAGAPRHHHVFAVIQQVPQHGLMRLRSGSTSGRLFTRASMMMPKVDLHLPCACRGGFQHQLRASASRLRIDRPTRMPSSGRIRHECQRCPSMAPCPAPARRCFSMSLRLVHHGKGALRNDDGLAVRSSSSVSIWVRAAHHHDAPGRCVYASRMPFDARGSNRCVGKSGSFDQFE